MNPNCSLKTALLLGFASAAVLAANPAAAQAVAAVGRPEVVIVTGTLIPQANALSESPILTVSPLDITTKGATDISDVLNDLPQTFISNTSDFSNTNNPLTSPGGVTTVDLRGLGPTRTLVLVNGRRLGVGERSKRGRSAVWRSFTLRSRRLPRLPASAQTSTSVRFMGWSR